MFYVPFYSLAETSGEQKDVDFSFGKDLVGDSHV